MLNSAALKDRKGFLEKIPSDAANSCAIAAKGGTGVKTFFGKGSWSRVVFGEIAATLEGPPRKSACRASEGFYTREAKSFHRIQ